VPIEFKLEAGENHKWTPITLMDDVFVSYRRGDSHAAQSLAKALKEALPTFIDVESIGLGRELEGAILPAVRGARVVVVIIGRGWLTRDNLKRLHSEIDWVRRELIEALAQPGKPIIPVLVDPGISMPLPEELPMELRRLLDRAHHVLSGDRWEEDVEVLIDEIRDMLAPRPAVASAMPADIPFLCDRIPQDDGFVELAPTALQTKAIFCIVHGHMFEAHFGYMRRLRQRGTLERLFAVPSLGIDLRVLEWNRGYAERGLYDKLLRSAIKRNVMHDELATNEELTSFLKNTGRPTVMVLQIAWADVQQCKSLLGALERAWGRLVGGLGAVPAHVLVLCINLTYHEASQEIGTNGPNVLERLRPVKMSDVLTWMELAEVHPYIATHKTEFLNMAQRVGDGELHMQNFVDFVHSLISVQPDNS
jgi:hypothetical protein